MKKITPLILALLSITGYSQNANLDELLTRYESLPINGGSIYSYFNAQEIETLRLHLQSQNTTQNATQQEGDGTIIYGANTDLGNLVNFSSGTPTDLNVLGTNSGSADFEAAGEIDPEDLDIAYVLTLENGELYELDVNTATYSLIGNIAPPSGENWNGIEIDPSTGIAYGISSNFVNTSTLSVIDFENLTATPVGITGMPGAISITTDGEGNFFSHDIVMDYLYSVDVTTGIASLIDPLGFDANFGQGLEYDAASGIFYMTAFNLGTFTSELRTVNVNTGATTFVSFLGDQNGANAQIPWASIANPSTLAVESQETITFNIFPNPVSDTITIQSTNSISSISIYNMLGQKIIDQQDVNQTTVTIASNKFTQGTYIITVQSGQNISTTKFITE